MASNTGQTSPEDDWLAKVEEEVLEPDLAIIDPHHHLWLRNGYTYMMPELAVDLASGHNIAATVFAECHSMYRQDGPEAEKSLGETEFVRGQAAMSASGAFGPARACDVMFGNVDMTLGAGVEPLLERHMETSGGRFRGVRYSTGWDEDERIHNVAPDQGMLVHKTVKEAVAVLDRMDEWNTRHHGDSGLVDRVRESRVDEASAEPGPPICPRGIRRRLGQVPVPKCGGLNTMFVTTRAVQCTLQQSQNGF